MNKYELPRRYHVDTRNGLVTNQQLGLRNSEEDPADGEITVPRVSFY